MERILKYFPELSARSIELLKQYADILRWWNARVNLISRQDTANVEERHLLHSLSIAKWISFSPATQLLDLGTGGGLPGIPLAIFFPECSFTLIDGRGKKIKAIQSMVRDLQLNNVEAFHSRAEDFSGSFDFVVSRAVATLGELWQWALPLLGNASHAATEVASGNSIDNGIIVLKGGDLRKEIVDLGKVGKKIKTFAIQDFFPEDYFLEKFIIYVPANKSA